MPAAKPSHPSAIELLTPLSQPALDPTKPNDVPSHGSPNHVAILVCHGMGQQVRFETLMDLANAIQRSARSEVQGKIGARAVRIGEKERQVDTHRVEMTLRTDAGAERQVHLYEAYWAPLTEGRVGIREVVSFLLTAGWGGWVNVRGKIFRRWMFGRTIDHPIQKTSTRRKLLGALAIVLSLLVINAAVAVVGIARATTIGPVGWPPSDLVRRLAVEVLILLGVMVAAGTAVSSKDPRLAWPLIWAALAGTVGIAAVMVFELARSLCSPASSTNLSCWLALFLVFLWAALIALSRRVRYFLIQYVGDVAAYVSAHTVSRFAEVREAIQKASFSVARAVYTALSKDGGAFAYGKVIVVGHSLGSVVAYDTLNAMIREDRVAATSYAAVSRTPLLLTFGSPLNKTAFIFRTQMPEGSELREALAASVQPMIQSYDLRPAQWVNIYAPADWISGPLEFYDDPEDRDPGHRSKQVKNITDPDATTPLGAHVEYWGNRTLADRLTEAVFG